MNLLLWGLRQILVFAFFGKQIISVYMTSVLRLIIKQDIE